MYAHVLKSMDPSKVFLGLPGYGWYWRIHAEPSEWGGSYRGESHTYLAVKYWMEGVYSVHNFTQTAPEGNFVPFAAYWDEDEQVPYMLPHVYDFVDGKDAGSRAGPAIEGWYGRRSYLTCYGKTQKTVFRGVTLERSGVPDSTDDEYMGIGSESVTLNGSGTAFYDFSLPAGSWDIAVCFVFPFFSSGSISFRLDGQPATISESRLWWPYWRKTVWKKIGTVGGGSHTLEVAGAPLAQFYGFRACSAFSESAWCGEAEFTLSPRPFVDVNGADVVPRNGFRLTTEALRRPPDSALVWYEDWRDGMLAQYWKQPSPEAWGVWQDGWLGRPYSQLEGSGEIWLEHEGFGDMHVRATIAFPAGSRGRGGIMLGTLWLCINMATQCLELWQGGSLLGSYQSSYANTPAGSLKGSPALYTIAMRKRGSRVRVDSGANNTLRFTANISAQGSGRCGYKSDCPVMSDLLRVGDAWQYEPAECFEVVAPDGAAREYGRLARSGVAWESEFGTFRILSDIEERDTRSEDISADYGFYHTGLLPLACPGDHQAVVRLKDINTWVARLYLGDDDGFSVLWYSDIDSLRYWIDRAAYEYGFAGFALWALGQEPWLLWEALPSLI